jgi:hypothetical protein
VHEWASRGRDAETDSMDPFSHAPGSAPQQSPSLLSPRNGYFFDLALDFFPFERLEDLAGFP